MKRTYTIIASIAIVFVATTSYAAGKVNLFEAVTVNVDTLVANTKVYLNGAISNNTKTKGKGNPVVVKDDLTVSGTLTAKNLSISGTTCVTGQVLKKTASGWKCATDETGSDSDTLAGLSCSNGQVAKKGTSGWSCGNDVDTLAALSCGSGQYVYWTGTLWGCRSEQNLQSVYNQGRDIGVSVGYPVIFTTLGSGTSGTAVAIGGDTTGERYLQLDYTTNGSPLSFECDAALEVGRAITSAGKLWICTGVGGWKSVTLN